MKENKEKVSKFYEKWWFWIIIVVILVAILGGGSMETKNVSTNTETSQTQYKNNYEWNLKDTKTNNDYKYVVLGVENENGDLESGEYLIKTNNNSKASFVIYVTDQYYEKDTDIPDDYDGMVQGFDKSECSVNLIKGQYLYLIQNSNGQGKVIVTKK